MATFTVTNAGDAGAGSLRDAVAQANARAGADTIVFSAAFDGQAADVIRLTGGQITITDTLTIDGGPARVTITGDALGDDVTLAGGITDVAASGADGLDDNSRIFNSSAETLTLASLVLTGGSTVGAGEDGGAVRGRGVVLTDSVVAGNSTRGAGAQGGGVYASADLIATDSTFSGNRTFGSGADGGGVAASVVALTNSTVSDNGTAGGGSGGGVYGSFSVTLTNSTVSGNSADGANGGGVAGQTVTLTNSTVSGNIASGVTSYGGGVFATNRITLTDSIVLGNVSTDTRGTLVRLGVNILDIGAGGIDIFQGEVSQGFTTAEAVFDATVTVAGYNKAAGLLADNGGPVRTIALKASGLNPALDRSAGGTVSADARGVAAADVPGVGAAGAGAAVRDVGAFELSATAETASLVVTTAADVADAFDGQTSLREAVAFANATAGAQRVTFSAAFNGQAADVIRLTGGQIVVTDAAGLTIDGGARGVTITADAAGDDVTLAGGITDVAASGADRLDDNSRIFDATAGDLTLDSLTLTGGRTTAQNESGGAVRAVGAVTLLDSTIAGNSVAGAYARAGGVRADAALTLTNSTLSGNRTEGYSSGGGGGYSRGAVTLTDSIVSGNSTAGERSGGGGVAGLGAVTLIRSTVSGNGTAGAFSDGGGVYGRAGVTLTNSAVSANSTAGQGSDGGGVYGFDAVALANSAVSGNRTLGLNSEGGGVSGATVTLTNSTVAGNRAAASSGGGVFGEESVTLTNSTISGNSTGGAESVGGGVGGGTATLTNTTVSGNSTEGDFAFGGGVFATDATTLTDSIVLGNVASNNSGDEVAGTRILTGGNIVGNGAGGANVFSGGTDVGDTTAAAVFARTTTLAGGVVAGVLADNGGPVRTIALRSGAANPALDRSTGGGVTEDARGEAAVDLARTGAAGSGGVVRDLGAFELAPPVITSGGGGATAALRVVEGVTLAATFSARAPANAALVWSIAGGADAARFAINAVTGRLTFLAAPDFEQPNDRGANNVHDLVVRATAAGLIDQQTVAVTITNRVETQRVTLSDAANLFTAPSDDIWTVDGRGGNDAITTRSRADSLLGGEGNDTLDGGTGNDTLDGGAGVDTALYAGTAAVRVSLATTAAQNTAGAGTDTLRLIENLTGGSGNDTLTGSTLANRLDGGVGGDALDGGSGSDTLVGGAGADTLIGGAGADVFVFGAGESVPGARDQIRGFDGAGAAVGDRIDLSAIDANAAIAGNQAFVFGTATGVGRLYVRTEGTATVVFGNIDADAEPEFAIVILDGGVAASAYTTADFVL